MSLVGFFAASFVIGVLVLVHELGHFLVAKYYGVGVLRFAIGFGPVILQFRRGETTYQIGCIPLGGYVRMVGDTSDVITGDTTDTQGKSLEDESSNQKEQFTKEEREAIKDPSRWFINKPKWQQIAVIAAGPVSNFILAIVLTWLTVYFAGLGEPGHEAVIGGIARKMPAGLAGLELGDRVTKINGVIVSQWSDLLERITGDHGKALVLDVQRGGQDLTFTVTPVVQRGMENFEESQKRYVIGIMPKSTLRKAEFVEAIKISLKVNYQRTSMTIDGLLNMMMGKISPKELAGPIFIFTQSGKQAEHGWDSLFDFMALLSISLGVLNLLPIPILDGGHIFFLLIESVFGAISVRKKEIAQQAGAALLLAVLVLVLYNDGTRKQENVEWTFDKEPKATGQSSSSDRDKTTSQTIE